MPQLVPLGNRRNAAAVMAPNWVARAMSGARPLGRGSYARVFGCADGSALKITGDLATMALARKLASRPSAGFPRIERASMLPDSGSPRMAIKASLLFPVVGWKKESIRRAYEKALLEACRARGFKGRARKSARAFARRLAASTPGPCPEFSAEICERLARLCRGNPEGESLARALRKLGRFCLRERFDVDLMGMSNWMVDAKGRLTLSDPVVRKAYDF